MKDRHVIEALGKAEVVIENGEITMDFFDNAVSKAKEVFDVIHEAEGLALMAHPKFWTTDVALLESGLRELKAQGLDGIEAVYSQNKIEETMCHLHLAKSLDFCVSAGSDFHGENKKMQHFGMEIGEDIPGVRWVFNMI